MWPRSRVLVIIRDMETQAVASVFAANIIRYRKRRGLSQYDLADLTGISRRMIGHYEKEGMVPPIEKLELLAKALDVPISKLFEKGTSESNTAADLSGIDPRSVKKLKDILSLSPEDRNDLYRMLNKLLRKNQLEKESGKARILEQTEK